MLLIRVSFVVNSKIPLETGKVVFIFQLVVYNLTVLD